MQLKIPFQNRSNHTVEFKRRREWMEAYCKAILYERYGERSGEVLWGNFRRTKSRKELETADKRRMTNCCIRVDIYALVKRFISYVPDKSLIINFSKKKRSEVVREQMTLTAFFCTGYMERLYEIAMKKESNKDKDKNKMEFHEGLIDFLFKIVGDDVYLFNISRLTTVIEIEGQRLAEWYSENVETKKYAWTAFKGKK